MCVLLTQLMRLFILRSRQELSSFVDQPDVITHVALVKPKPGVFIDEITSLLVICTPVSVLLIGVSATPVTTPSNRTHKEIKLYATDMTVPSDVEMTSVIGTQEGRIFMCGAQDGCLYELHYQEKEGWFGKRVQLVNHSVGTVQSLIPRLGGPKSEGETILVLPCLSVADLHSDRITTVVADHARGCFYTLSSKNTISVYKPTTDKNIQHVQTVSNIYKAASDKAPGSPALTPQNFQIISLHVVDPAESRSDIQLMAMTANGARLYFAPSSISSVYGYSVGGGSTGVSRPLQLLHVRLPPSNLLHPDEQSNPYRPAVAAYGLSQAPQPAPSRPYIMSKLENSCYETGLTIAAQPGDPDGTDYILCLAPDLTRIGSLGQLHGPPPHQPPPQYAASSFGAVAGPSRPPLTEYATVLSIPGRTWAMAPVPRLTSPASSTPPNTPSPIVINELANQFSEPARQFMILTNVGLTFLAKRRALDYLRDVIEEFQAEGNAQPLIEFRDR